MEKKISTNQLCLIFVILTVSLKLTLLPAIMFRFAGKNSYISMLISLFLEGLSVAIILAIMIKAPEKSFSEFLSEVMGKPISFIIHTILLVFFFSKCILAFQKLHSYYVTSLYEDLNSFFLFLGFGFFLLFILNKDFRTLGRTLQVCFWPMAVGVLFTLIFPVGDVDATNLFPIFNEGLHPILNACFRTSFAFGDYMIFLILMGQVKFGKNPKKSLWWYALAVDLFIFLFYVMFIGVFGNTSINQVIALGDLPLNNPFPSTLGKFEWLTIIIWTLIIIFQISLHGNACVSCMKKMFNFKKSKWPALIISITLMLAVTLTYLRLEITSWLFYNEIFVGITIGFQTLTIVLLIICFLVVMRRQKNTNSQDNKKEKLNKEKLNAENV